MSDTRTDYTAGGPCPCVSCFERFLVFSETQVIRSLCICVSGDPDQGMRLEDLQHEQQLHG